MTLEKAIEFGKIFLKSIENEKGSATYEFVETEVKALEELSEINKIITSDTNIQEDVLRYKMIKEVDCGKSILDKIRAEILEEKEWAYADFEQYKIDYLGVDAEYVEDELPQDDFRYGMERVIEIIDKYRAEARYRNE